MAKSVLIKQHCNIKNKNHNNQIKSIFFERQCNFSKERQGIGALNKVNSKPFGKN
jgi:hypothetical protein